ncbi:hypothetical protein [Kerstersia similis]|uniref:hypothetical protein n=1 Tax=Kerstersia similis TaxID=206505 RepID=UPI0039F0F165
MMNIKLIRTEQDYEAAMERIGVLWGAPVGSPEGDELEVLGVSAIPCSRRIEHQAEGRMNRSS